VRKSLIGAQINGYIILIDFDHINGPNTKNGLENGLVVLFVFKSSLIDAELLGKKLVTSKKE
jgi:hypothetical protein